MRAIVTPGAYLKALTAELHSCGSSFWDAVSPQTSCTSVSVDDEGTEKTSAPEVSQRVDSQQHFRSSASQPQPLPPSEAHHCSRVELVSAELANLLQGLVSSKDDFDHHFAEAASDTSNVSFHEACATSLPSVQAVAQFTEDTGKTGLTAYECGKTLKYEDKREVISRSAFSTPPDYTQTNSNAGISAAPAGYSVVVSPLTSRIPISTPTSIPAISRTDSPSAESQPCDTASAKRSCSFMSAAREVKYPHGKNTTVEPLMNHMYPQLQRKRRREASASHGTEQPEAEKSSKALDDLVYCPSTCDESEDDSDGLSRDETRLSRNRRRSRSVLTKTKAPSQESIDCESAGLDQASEPIAATPEDAHNVAVPTDAVFDEWILQDVVLKRTIMDGRATFLFQLTGICA
ncbi:hypothetical protein NHJ13051_009590 [Beauveria bassiana]